MKNYYEIANRMAQLKMGLLLAWESSVPTVKTVIPDHSYILDEKGKLKNNA